MKRMKILNPLLAIATVGSIAPIATLATSCNQDTNKEEITLDASTPKERTTSVNKTMTRYAFNLKNSLKVTNEEDEIDVSVEDVESTDGVTVEISAIQYDATTGKFYVTITTSKEDGTLNDQETVNFSLNFHCHRHGSTVNKWTKKFTKFIIKHSKSLLDDVHFDDTDLEKHIRLNQKGDFSETITMPATDVWKSEPAEGELDIDNLNCYILRDRSHFHWVETITLPETAIKPTYDETNQTISITINGNINEFAHFGEKAKFTLLFTYPDSTVFQAIGGFSVQYLKDIEMPHVALISSREQHYYLPLNTSTETALNTVAFALDESGMQPENFEITTSNSRIKIVDKYIFESQGANVLIVNYTLDSTNWEGPDFVSNVTFNIKYTKDTVTWTESIYGLSFFMVGKDWVTDSLIHADSETLNSVVWKIGDTNFDDVLRCCFPFTIDDFTYTNAYAMIDDQQSEFTIDQLGYSLWNEKYSVATLKTPDGITAGKHTVKIYVCVISHNAAYYYTLDAGEQLFV